VTPDPAPIVEDNEHDDGDADGTDVAAVLATLNERAAARPTKQAVLGRITDGHGEPAVAATVVATSPNLEGERVVLTDEHGDYEVFALPPGFYTITIYYLDNTFVRTDVASREIEATHFDIALSEPAPHEDSVPPVVEPEQGMTIINGEPPFDLDDVETSTGITFSGTVALENGLVDGFK
jgi:hypothetical protein